MLREALTAGRYHKGLRLGHIIVLYEKGDPREIRNYRPITLLHEVDYHATRPDRDTRVLGDPDTPSRSQATAHVTEHDVDMTLQAKRVSNRMTRRGRVAAHDMIWLMASAGWLRRRNG